MATARPLPDGRASRGPYGDLGGGVPTQGARDRKRLRALTKPIATDSRGVRCPHRRRARETRRDLL